MTEYLKQTFDYQDPNFASVNDELCLWSSRFGELLFDHLELARGISVLDVGCGGGFPLFELAHVHGPSCRFIGVDSWSRGIDRAAFKLRIYKLANLQLLRADGAQLPLKSSQFDLIVSNLGINNFANPPAALSECARVAKPQARIILTTNLKGYMREFYAVYREVLTELSRHDYLDRLNANESHRTTRASLCNLVQESGFSISRVIEDRFYLRYLDGSAMLRHARIRFGFLDDWRAVVDPDDEEMVFTMLEEKLNESARRSGELRMTVPMLYLEGMRE